MVYHVASQKNSDNASGHPRDRQYANHQNVPGSQLYASLGSAFSFLFNARDKRIKMPSSEVYSLLGYDTDKLQDIHWLSFVRRIHPDDLQPLLRLLKKIKECLQNPEECKSHQMKLLLDFRIKHAKGKYVRLLIQTETHKPVNSAKGVVWIGLASDISFLKMDGKVSFSCQNENNHNKINSTEFETPRKNGLFSSREREVLKLLAQGYNSRRIQEALNISQHTVRTHRRNMHKKCNVENTAQLIKLAIREGYV